MRIDFQSVSQAASFRGRDAGGFSPPRPHRYKLYHRYIVAATCRRRIWINLTTYANVIENGIFSKISRREDGQKQKLVPFQQLFPASLMPRKRFRDIAKAL